MKSVVSYYIKTIIDLTRFFGVNRAFRCALYRIVSDVGGHLLSHKDAVDIDGFKMYIIHDDIGISRELRVFGIHEPLALRLFISELREGMYVVDVGSNIGYYCLFESVLVGHGGRILAIEPNPVSYECLSKNIQVNGVRNVRLSNECVWSENREVSFLMTKASNLSKVVEIVRHLNGSTENGQVISVQARRLDDIIDTIQKLDFLRMDIEGGEYELLKGAQKSISRFHPRIFLELHIPILGKERCRVILECLRSYGYTIKYLVYRRIDLPLVASLDDIKVNVSIENLIRNPPPLDLHLFLTCNTSHSFT